MKEIEVKIKISNPEEIAERIKNIGGVFVREVNQKMYGLFLPNYENVELGIFPRIRTEGGETTLTIKVKNEQSNLYFKRDEYTLKINDEKIGLEIMKLLGYSIVRPIEKTRKEWKWNKVSLCIDTLYFGVFLEIEGEEKEIEKTIEALGLKKEERIIKSYLYLEDVAINEAAQA